MSERKLATVQTISAIADIVGADFIGLATFNSIGWQCVVKKSDFKPGYKCVFFEIDSLVPDTEPFAFLQGKRRIRSMKLKGTLSQGLALPLSAFEIYGVDSDNWTHETEPVDGDDLTEALGVEQYEPPQSGQPGYSSGPPEGSAPFPFFLGLKKTDEERIQSSPKLLEDLAGLSYTVTVKLDGQSATYAWTKDSGLIVCSRNLWIQQEDNSSFWQVARNMGLDTLTEFSGLAIQGEVCGPGIQGNKLGLKELNFFVFNLFDMEKKEYLNPDSVIKVCSSLSLPSVPVAERKTKFKHTQDSLLELARGNYLGTKTPREGIVVRSNDGVVSFKVINNDFLLHYKGE